MKVRRESLNDPRPQNRLRMTNHVLCHKHQRADANDRQHHDRPEPGASPPSWLSARNLVRVVRGHNGFFTVRHKYTHFFRCAETPMRGVQPLGQMRKWLWNVATIRSRQAIRPETAL